MAIPQNIMKVKEGSACVPFSRVPAATLVLFLYPKNIMTYTFQNITGLSKL